MEVRERADSPRVRVLDDVGKCDPNTLMRWLEWSVLADVVADGRALLLDFGAEAGEAQLDAVGRSLMRRAGSLPPVALVAPACMLELAWAIEAQLVAAGAICGAFAGLAEAVSWCDVMAGLWCRPQEALQDGREGAADAPSEQTPFFAATRQ